MQQRRKMLEDQDLELARARALRRARITYAATDAWACRELFLRFRSLGLLRAKAPAGI